ncbi:hypothetical protein L1276_003203 [Flavobacterium sp. HSC-32F16]|uniref:oxidoreductase n=1 Tax=Flavobacterium sp. HSC-32F16 TaxID=2910964 RepID=UPI0020A59999|nr:oxidoreductase [Flavobacterium sp. HSC-32F16]MCP2028035.1 hypothetical protein [Flavobacterium sp. HSC-32F16]
MKIKLYALSTVLSLLLFSCNKKENTTIKLPEAAEHTETGTDTLQEADETPRKQSINLFTVMPKDSSDIAFISLSDVYSVGYEKDTLALPNVEKMGKENARYFTFGDIYRKRLLTGANISETDSVFIIDYAKNKRVSFAVKNLKTAAMLSLYSSGEDWPYRNFDYMIGFEIDKKLLNGFSEYYSDALVYVGKENPFSKERLKPISWEKIAKKDYPSKTMKNEERVLLKNTVTGNTYKFKTDSHEYYLQDYLDSDKIIYGRRLLVINSTTKDIIIEKVYHSNEGSSPCPLNYEEGDEAINQWTGKLFKNKPPVVFGFEYVSFGCPGISIIDKSNEDIYLQCDNRH